MSDETDRLLGDQIADMLAEEDAEAYDRNDSVSMSLVGDAELWRVWPELSPDIIPQAIAFLDKYASVKNFEKNTPLKYVDDPKVGRETWGGRWRVAYVRKVTQGEVPKLVQVLRKGFAQEIKWDEARYAGELQYDKMTDLDGDPPTVGEREKFIDVKWANCDPSKAHELAESLRGLTITSPVIHGETVEGEWKTLIVATAIEEDGSASVTAKLAIPGYTLNAFADWGTGRDSEVIYQWGCTREEAQAILDVWKVGGKGRTATCSNNRETGLIDIIKRRRYPSPIDVEGQITSLDCRYTDSTDYHFGVSDATAYPVGAAGGGISWSRSLRDNGDGTYDILLTKRTVKERELGKTDAIYTHQENEHSAQTIFQLGMDKISDRVSIASPSSGEVLSQRIDIRDDCSVDVVTVKETAKSGKQNTVAVLSPAGVTTTTEHLAVGPTDVVVPASAENGVIRKVIKRVSRFFNRQDITVEESVPTDLVADLGVGHAEHTEWSYGESHTNADASGKSLTALEKQGVPEAGEHIEYSEGRTEYGLWATRVRRYFPRKIDPFWNAFHKDYFSSSASSTELNACDKKASSAITTAVGDFSNEPSRFKDRWHTRVVTETPVRRRLPSVSSKELKIQESDDEEVWLWRGHNQPIADGSLPAPNRVGFGTGSNREAGDQISIEGIGINRHGLIDYSKVKRIAKDPLEGQEYQWWTRGDVYWIPSYDTLYGTGRVVGGTPWLEAYQHSIKYFRSLPAAIGHLGGGPATKSLPTGYADRLGMPWPGSSVDKVAPGLWRAHKITRQDCPCGGYQLFA